MTDYPVFPHFKPISLEDGDFLQKHLWDYQPQTSELTFTNLYIWRDAYQTQWAMLDDVLLLLAQEKEGEFYGLPPVAAGSRLAATEKFLNWLQEERDVADPRIERADEQLVRELADSDSIVSEPTRDQFDYLYLREDLAELRGRDYSNKRNHINYFERTFEWNYEPLTAENIPVCIEMAAEWCEKRDCEDDMNLLHERNAVFSALEDLPELPAHGGVLWVAGQLEAFSIGELLNNETLLVHIEKANSGIRGLYQMINREFVRNFSQEALYVNREQDLGVPGLRRAKKSYYPTKMVKKYRLQLA